MSANKSWSSIGEEIRGAVEDALRTGDFRDLGDAVTGTVKDVSAKVGQAVSDGINGTHNYTEQWENATRERKRAQAENERKERIRAASAARLQAPFVKVGRISGTLYQVFGGVGTGVMAILSAVFLGLGIGLGGGWMVTFFILFILLLSFIGMINVGCKQKFRLKRAQKYLELSGHNHYINLDNLALHTGKTKKFVLKDVKRMLDKGFFPEGHLDTQETCLMLDDKIYREYLDLEKQRKLQEREQKAQELKTAVNPPQPASNSELDDMIAEGQDCIRKLRDMNDNIAGEEISAKLFRLENLLKEIFEGLREHPEQMPQMKKFMNYYLPTTLKLVGAYEEFDDLSAQGEEILEAKAEIEKTLDSINSAFEELLNRMFRSTAFDVTTDAQVLQTMLAKEGLTRQREFEKIPK
ncbi:MAG: 5-bromo-4-chloroindolyl phosphate hydrolysis family protein [Acetatifactor sp.]